MKRLQETDKLERELKSVGFAMRRQVFYQGVVILARFVFFALIAFFALDYLTDMPFVVRLVIVLGGLGYAGYWFQRTWLVPSRQPVEAHAISLVIEGKHPELQSRMISTLQFQALHEINPGTSENLVEGLVRQTFDWLRDFNLWEVVDRGWFKRQGMLLLCALVIVGGTVVLVPRYFGAFLMRLVVPSAVYPTRTKIVEVKFPEPLPAGDPFTIEVTGGGVLPKLGKVLIVDVSKDGEGGEAELDLTPIEGKEGSYTADVPPLQGPVELTVYLGDARKGPIKLNPDIRPFLKSVLVKVRYPAYTGRGVEEEQTCNLRILIGTELEFYFEASKPIAKIAMETKREGVTLPTLKKTGKNKWVGKMVVDSSFAFTLTMQDTIGLVAKDLPQYRIAVSRDRAPTIRLIRPKGSREAAPMSRIPFEFHIRDDYKVGQVRVRYEVVEGTDDVDAGEVQNVQKGIERTYLEENNVGRDRYTFKGIWDNRKLRPTPRPGQFIKLWVEASDNQQPKPQTTRSSEVLVRIITPEEYQRLLWERFGQKTENIDDHVIEIKTSTTTLKRLQRK